MPLEEFKDPDDFDSDPSWPIEKMDSRYGFKNQWIDIGPEFGEDADAGEKGAEIAGERADVGIEKRAVSGEELMRERRSAIRAKKLEYYTILFREFDRDGRWEMIIRRLLQLVMSPETPPGYAIKGCEVIINRLLPKSTGRRSSLKDIQSNLRDASGDIFIPYSRQVAESLTRAIVKYEEANKATIPIKDVEYSKDPSGENTSGENTEESSEELKGEDQNGPVEDSW